MAYLLGLIVGSDILGVLKLFSSPRVEPLTPITVLGAEQHIQTYKRALGRFGLKSESYDSEEVALAAYVEMYKQLSNS